ncbi:anaerobic ribonucleoside-triphosphate reductase activating protein [Bowdeniella nasicola]|uniref:Anaerobic ribonucleoside-triphosphate reductase activating protein n=1 Tax=Bowdeniella nasicola TaxID=208480 RepID=A0A1Q5Q450_9ACTO|nr:anaerobic ribonucleoside-triphosphate reductase activating protein [Bowdeniella nasicola]
MAGLVPLSSVDWPGKLVATVFVQGCPWRCTYCHNTGLLDCRAPGTRMFDDVLQLLERRRGLLDGVIFSGGEATRHPALPAAIAAVRAAGFDVGLHTGGGFPKRLAEIAPQLSWVGFDVKGQPADYPSVVGVPEIMGQRAWLALEALLDARRTPTVEARMTVYPGSHTRATILECARRALDLGVDAFALQEARTADGSRPYRPENADPDWDFDELAADVQALADTRIIIRAAKD